MKQPETKKTLNATNQNAKLTEQHEQDYRQNNKTSETSQEHAINQNQSYDPSLVTITNKEKKIFVKTYGCQMNVYDSEKIVELMQKKGYVNTDNQSDADLVVLNTCHIREKAAEKVYSELGRIKKTGRRTGKDQIIVVSGCVAQAEGEEIFRRAPYVDIVVGPQSYHNLGRMVDEAHKAVEASMKSEEALENNKIKKQNISLEALTFQADLTQQNDNQLNQTKKKEAKKQKKLDAKNLVLNNDNLRLRRKSLQKIELEFIEEKKFDYLEEELNDNSVLENIKSSSLSAGKSNMNFGDDVSKYKFLTHDIQKHVIPAKASEFISVQEGCDKFCAFCVVPYTRGAEFSRPLDKVIKEVMHKVSKGAKEIVFLGQNVNAYHGKTSEGNVEASLADLIRKTAEIDSVKRIRFTTSHPMDMTDELIDLFGTESKLMPYFNLPIQSGSTEVLKLMNRKYTREKYLEIITKLKVVRPDIAMSSDFIVGFPGETEKDFEDTISLIKEVGFAQAYSFKYSMRPGTPAADRPQVPEEEKTHRLIRIQEVITQEQKKFNDRFLGNVLPVLFDREGRLEGQVIGRTPHMQSVYLKHSENDSDYLKNSLIEVRILKAYQTGLSGELI